MSESGLGAHQTLEILRMGQAGDGVARLADGRLAFVPGALPGELVDAAVTEERKNFVRARLIRRQRSAAERIEPICPLFSECGGCSFQHWDYQAELLYKESRVKEALRRIAHHDPEIVGRIRGSQDPYGYRNKGQFPFGGSTGHAVLGLYRRGTHQVIPADHCDIQDPLINKVLAVGQSMANRLNVPPYDEAHDTGVLRHLLIRSSRREQQILVLLVVRQEHPALETLADEIMRLVPEVQGIGVNINPDRTNRILGPTTTLVRGQDTITDVILGRSFRLSFTSFFQVNPTQVGVLYETALGFLPPHTGEVWDLYSGVGTLAALAAGRARFVRALEVNADAVQDARQNFALNHIENVAIDAGRVEDLIAQWVREQKAPPDAVIVDPPRAGLNPEVIQQLKDLRPGRIIYVSCNPDTWARDAESLTDSFQIAQAIPVDMFPRTDHVEVASCLLRR